MERYSFFNAVSDGMTYDREYLAEDFARYFASFIGTGVYANSGSELKVVPQANMTVIVKPGKAWVNGYFYENTDNKSLQLDLAEGATDRIDRIVVRLDLINRKISTEIKKGISSVSAVAPELQRDANIYEICLADISVKRNAVKINDGDIKDQRMNSSVCGVVAGVVNQIDTEGLFSQYDAEFTEWFNKVKGQLSEDAAGKLQVEIDGKEDKFTKNTAFNKNFGFGKEDVCRGDRVRMVYANGRLDITYVN